MTALALNVFQRPEHALGRSFALSAIIHVALAAVLFLGVRWQSHAPETVTVDLVESPPPAPAPVAEAPKPPPPEIKPEPPQVRKPDIAMPEKKKVVKEPPKKAPPKVDPDFQKRLREQVALEQKALDRQKQERELRDLLARQQADAARQAAAARNKALNEYIGRIQATIRRNIPQTAIEGIPGNPAALVDVVQLPTGEVLSVRVRKSSGYPRYDEAIERAILKASPLPLPPSRDLFDRELKLTFRPLDK
jgi:colicin import membrane protein